MCRELYFLNVCRSLQFTSYRAFSTRTRIPNRGERHQTKGIGKEPPTSAANRARAAAIATSAASLAAAAAAATTAAAAAVADANLDAQRAAAADSLLPHIHP